MTYSQAEDGLSSRDMTPLDALDRIRAAYERQETDLVASLTLDGLQHEIERGGLDEATMKRIRRRFIDLTEPTESLHQKEAVA